MVSRPIEVVTLAVAGNERDHDGSIRRRVATERPWFGHRDWRRIHLSCCPVMCPRGEPTPQVRDLAGLPVGANCCKEELGGSKDVVDFEVGQVDIRGGMRPAI